MDEFSTRDMRNPEQLRDKERRMRYRNVSSDVMGSPIPQTLGSNGVIRGSPTWSNKNKYKLAQYKRRSVTSVRRDREVLHGKGKLMKHYFQAAVRNENGGSRRATLPQLNTLDDDSWGLYHDQEGEEEDGFFADVPYSFDEPGPTDGESILHRAVSDAVSRMQNKELAMLLKNEYDIIEASDTDEEYEFV